MPNRKRTCLLAGLADHFDLGYVQVAMFLGVGVHCGLGLFLGAVHIGMPDFAGAGYGVTDVWRELNGLAFYFPGASVACGYLELAGAVSLSQTPGDVADLRALVLFRRVLRQEYRRDDETRRREKIQCPFEFHASLLSESRTNTTA